MLPFLVLQRRAGEGAHGAVEQGRGPAAMASFTPAAIIGSEDLQPEGSVLSQSRVEVERVPVPTAELSEKSASVPRLMRSQRSTAGKSQSFNERRRESEILKHLPKHYQKDVKERGALPSLLRRSVAFLDSEERAALGRTTAVLEHEQGEKGRYEDAMIITSHSQAPETAASRKRRRRQRWYSEKMKRFVLNPADKRLRFWDFAICVVLAYTTVVTPYEVSLLESSNCNPDARFIVDRFVDAIFLLDVLMQFFLMYPSTLPQEDGHIKLWISDPGRIAHHYLTTWFALDMATSLVFIVEVLPCFDYDNGDGLQKLKGLRIFRALRLIKLLRLIRATRVARRWQASLTLSLSLLSLLKTIFCVLIFCHWMACLWVFQTDYPLGHLHTSWLFEFDYCRFEFNSTDFIIAPNEPSMCYESCPDTRCCRVACRGAWDKYVVALYWAIATLTSIGYGDIYAATGNTTEYFIASLLALAGSLAWSYVVASFCRMIATYNLMRTEFHQRLDELNHFMASEDLSPQLRWRIREYFFQSFAMKRNNEQRNMLLEMSPMLQSEVIMECNAGWLRRVWFLADANQSLVVDLALVLTPLLFPPGEVVHPGHLFIVRRGVALLGGRLLTRGRVWGEDLLLQSKNLRLNDAARAMSYLEVWACSERDLNIVIAAYPEDYRRIRRRTLWLALRREIVAQAREIVRQAEMNAKQVEEELKKGIVAGGYDYGSACNNRPKWSVASGLSDRRELRPQLSADAVQRSVDQARTQRSSQTNLLELVAEIDLPKVQDPSSTSASDQTGGRGLRPVHTADGGDSPLDMSPRPMSPAATNAAHVWAACASASMEQTRLNTVFDKASAAAEESFATDAAAVGKATQGSYDKQIRALQLTQIDLARTLSEQLRSLKTEQMQSTKALQTVLGDLKHHVERTELEQRTGQRGIGLFKEHSQPRIETVLGDAYSTSPRARAETSRESSWDKGSANQSNNSRGRSFYSRFSKSASKTSVKSEDSPARKGRTACCAPAAASNSGQPPPLVTKCSSESSIDSSVASASSE